MARHLEPAKGEEDWLGAREVLVKAYHNYPLYVHLEPDENKRPEFLRRYLEANYDVAVRQGKGLMLVLKMNQNKKQSCPEEKSDDRKIVGALLFVPAADDGIGWAIQDDRLYWDAYARENIAEVSEGCMERVTAYEAWENKHVTQTIRRARIPLWNGLFLALDPDFCPHGWGTMCYKKTIWLMCEQQRRAVIKELSSNNKEKRRFKSSTLHLSGNTQFVEARKSEEETSRPETESKSGISFFHSFSMLHHLPIPPPSAIPTRRNATEFTTVPGNGNRNRGNRNIQIIHSLSGSDEKAPFAEVSVSDSDGSPPLPKMDEAPLLAAISQNAFSTHFYEKVGFVHVAKMPYFPKNSKVSPFDVDVLFLDLFDTGRVKILADLFQNEGTSSQQSESAKRPLSTL